MSVNELSNNTKGVATKLSNEWIDNVVGLAPQTVYGPVKLTVLEDTRDQEEAPRPVPLL